MKLIGKEQLEGLKSLLAHWEYQLYSIGCLPKEEKRLKENIFQLKELIVSLEKHD